MKSSKGTVQLVATNNIFYEDINSHERRITWRCSKFYTKTPDRDRCQVSICLRSGLIAYVKGRHNHPDTFIEAKHASRRCEVDMTGKYKITGLWLPEKKPMMMERKYPEIRLKMKDLSRYKTQKQRGMQNFHHLNMQISHLLSSQVAKPPLSLPLLPLPPPPPPFPPAKPVEPVAAVNSSNSVIVPVTSTVMPQPADNSEDKDVSWHIPTFEGFF